MLLQEKTTIICNLYKKKLFQPRPVVWRENQSPGTITRLTAKDNDGPENGLPFHFSISSEAPYEILTKFDINGLLNK